MGSTIGTCRLKWQKVYSNACPSLLYVAPHCNTERSAQSPGKIKIGFMSSNFYNHAIGKHFRKVISNLSRELFNVYVFFGKEKADESSKFIERNADSSIASCADFRIVVQEDS